MPNTPFLRQKLAPSVRFALICKNSGVTLNQLLHFKGQFHYQVGILMLIATLILSAIILVAANLLRRIGIADPIFILIGASIHVRRMRILENYARLCSIKG